MVSQLVMEYDRMVSLLHWFLLLLCLTFAIFSLRTQITLQQRLLTREKDTDCTENPSAV